LEEEVKAEQEEVKEEEVLSEDSFDVFNMEGENKLGYTEHEPKVDIEGYYIPKTDEVIGDKYKVISIAGKGVFSCVLKAVNTLTQETVAIKIIKTHEVMTRAGLNEIEILKKLNSKDPEGRKYIIRMIDNFIHHSHLCLVFEFIGNNLREVLKHYGKSSGLSLVGVKMYA